MSISEIKEFDLKLLMAFCAVAEELHFGRAAARLHISQPPFSKYISRLEKLVGTPLLERTTRSVALTAAGSYFYTEARRVCDGLETALHQTRGIGRHHSGALTIGIAPSVSHTYLVEALYSYRESNPNVELRLQEMNSVDMVPALHLKQIDAALMRPIAASNDIEMKSVFEERLGLVVRKDSVLAGAGLVSVKRLVNHPIIGYKPSTSPYFHQLCTAIFQGHVTKPTVVQESQLPTILTLVEAGVGSAVVAESFARHYARKLEFIPIQEAGPIVARLVVGVLRSNSNLLVDNFVLCIERYMRHTKHPSKTPSRNLSK